MNTESAQSLACYKSGTVFQAPLSWCWRCSVVKVWYNGPRRCKSATIQPLYMQIERSCRLPYYVARYFLRDGVTISNAPD